jgi:hypothetical protein
VIQEIPLQVIDDKANVIKSDKKLHKLIFKNSKADEVFRADNEFDVLEKKILMPHDNKKLGNQKLSITEIITDKSEDHDGKSIYTVDCEHE